MDDNTDWGRLEKQFVYNTKKYAGFSVRHQAIEFGISPGAAKKMRARYLIQELKHWIAYAETCIVGIYRGRGRFTMPDSDWPSIIAELQILARKEEAPRKDIVTPDMIDQANRYPVNQLLDFRNGKIRCINPTHEDKRPTMFFGDKTNKAICPACQANYDAIAVIRILEGDSFSSAVKKLCSR